MEMPTIQTTQANSDSDENLVKNAKTLYFNNTSDTISRGVIAILCLIGFFLMAFATASIDANFVKVMDKSYLTSTALICFIQIIKIYMNWFKFSDYDSVNQFLLNNYYFLIILSIFENLCFAFLLMLQIGFSRAFSLDVLLHEDDIKYIIAWLIGTLIIIYRAISHLTECFYKPRKFGLPVAEP